MCSVSAGSFESAKEGMFTELKTGVGQWSANENHAFVVGGKAKTGHRALRLHGEGEVSATLTLPQAAKKGMGLSLYAERWTGSEPFAFRIDASSDGSDWKEIYKGDNEVKIGGYHAHIDLEIPVETTQLRFRCTAPASGGVLIDDILINEPGPATIVDVATHQAVHPAFVRETFNPIHGFEVTVNGRDGHVTLDAMEIMLTGTTRLGDIKEVQIILGSSDPTQRSEQVIAKTDRITERLVLSSSTTLSAGKHWFWVNPILKDQADIDGRIQATLQRIKSGSTVHEPSNPAEYEPQRIGYAVRLPGDDDSVSYRIPGLARSTKGTLIACYDIRYRHAGDLPADIDVGVSRSTDGGKSWGKMIVAMDMGNDPQFNFDGIGDPAILVDSRSGRLWLSALWSHGNNGWAGSGTGIKPEETGQFMLAYSDDDGKSWSKPINVTEQMKKPEWHLFFNGPGAGITLSDGTLVFAAQFKDENNKPWSTIIHSADAGKTWQVGSGVKIETTEAQVAQLADGSIMINCRDNRGGSRTVATTQDLGKTWQLHSTDRSALQEPVCMASLLAWDHPKHGRFLAFSNPNTNWGRHSMTVKISKDEGSTWPEEYFRLYDARNCMGYSCLAPATDEHLGVLYEGRSTMYFLRFPLTEWFQ